MANKLDSQEISGISGSDSERKLAELALTYNATAKSVSAKTGQGMQQLTEHLVGLLTGSASIAGSAGTGGIGPVDSFSARSRHLLALKACLAGLVDAQTGITGQLGAELVAEHLRHAQAELGSVCGEITTDELLGEIFGSFCIGK